MYEKLLNIVWFVVGITILIFMTLNFFIGQPISNINIGLAVVSAFWIFGTIVW